MSNRVMLALGEFRFEIGTAAYQNLNVSTPIPGLFRIVLAWAHPNSRAASLERLRWRAPSTPPFVAVWAKSPQCGEAAEEPLRLVSGTGKFPASGSSPKWVKPAAPSRMTVAPPDRLSLSFKSGEDAR